MSNGIIGGNVKAMCVIQRAFDPASVAANTTAEQTVTVPGVLVGDIVFVRKPTLTAGLGIVGARVSANDTVAITFSNNTGSPIDAGSEVYLFTVIRPEGQTALSIFSDG